MYSHLEEVNDNTLMTSIKIYAVDGIDNVQNIILTAFTYDDEDDFDDNGNYRGSSSYTINIKRKWFYSLSFNISKYSLLICIRMFSTSFGLSSPI